MTGKTEQSTPKRKFGTEKVVNQIFGFGLKKLRRDRMFRQGLPFYKVGARVLYDLEEVESIVRQGRVG